MKTGTVEQERITADPTTAGTLAQQIVELLINHDSGTRHRAVQAAMMLLGEPSSQRGNGQSDFSPAGTGGDYHGDLAAFFSRDDEMKPADYALLCAAYHFSQFGRVPFSVADIQSIAADAGVIVPNRLDMTLVQATKQGKKLFQKAGKGLFKPTAIGGLEFVKRWGVKPGRKLKAPTATKND